MNQRRGQGRKTKEGREWEEGRESAGGRERGKTERNRGTGLGPQTFPGL